MKLQKAKGYISIVLSISSMMMVQSCTKTTLLDTNNVSSLNIVNALPNSVPLIPVIGTAGPVIYNRIPGLQEFGSYQNLGSIGSITYGTNVVLTPVAGNDTVYLVQKNADTISNGKAPLSKYMFNQVLPLKGNTMYSLFITGKDTTAPDYVFVRDTLAYRADSTAGIRFVNLSTGSTPISVNIKGSANGSEAGAIAYKAITSFKDYAATYNISSYIFEIRDAGTGALITSYTLSGVNAGSTTAANNVRFKNLTIALIGQPGGTGANVQRIILINNF